MKKIIVASLLILLIIACKKQSDILPVENTIKEELADVPPCTGNTWSLVVGWPFYVYPSNVEFDYVVFNAGNKLFTPSHAKQRMYIYDGVGWTFISSAVPWNYSRKHFTSFTVGDKGYVFQDDVFPKLFEYNTTTNTWTDKGFFPGAARFSTNSFVIGSKAYVVGGYYYGPQNYKDVWEYDAANNTWTQKSDLPPGWGGRAGGAGFTINGKGYIAGGFHYFQGNPGSASYNNEVFEYNPVTDVWTPKAGYPGNIDLWSIYNSAATFVIGSSAYVSLNGTNFYKYSPATNLWSPSANLNSTTDDLNECTAVINSKGYVFNASGTNQMYKYTPKTCSGGTTP